MISKNDIRIEYRKIRKSISKEARNNKSTNICTSILEYIKENKFDAILMYCPLAEEVDVMGVFDELIGKLNIFFPRVSGDNMDFYLVNDYSMLEEGNFHVMEPLKDCDSLEYLDDNNYLMLVPGICFDEQGYRVGYGKGYYDKYLAKNSDKAITTIGVCYKECMIDSVMPDKYDIKVSKVIYD